MKINRTVNWHNIRTYNGSQYGGFEELCTQLARREEPSGAKFVRQNTPDKGIDCYWELSDGSKWGWQFKYYIGRLGRAQWGQIDKDIKAALKTHPELTRYYVCVPRNLTLKMNGAWKRHVAEWKALAKSETEREVEFIWWGDSELIGKLFEFNKHYLLKYFFGIHPEELFSTPEPLADFIASIADLSKVKSVLDPVCGSGLLLRKVADKTGAKSVYGVDRDPFSIEIAKRIFYSSEPNLIQGNIFTKHEEFPDAYDLVVTHMPFGVRLTENMASLFPDMKFERTFDIVLTLWILDQLAEDGRALLIVPPNFFSNRNAKHIQRVIIDKGLRIRAAIYIPERTFHWTALGSYLIVLERGSQEQMFVAEFQNDSLHQKKLLENFQKHQLGSRLGLGILCDPGSFKRFGNLVSSVRLSRLAKEREWRGWSAEELIIEHQLLNNEQVESIRYGSNSCFLRTLGDFKASTDLETLVGGRPGPLRHTVHLLVNPELVNPRYLAQWFNESPVGRATLATITSGNTLQAISLRDIMGLKFYLPPLEEQHKVIESVAELRRVRAVTDELENSLWTGGSSVYDTVPKIEDINQNPESEDKDWIDTLPFPLASILWRHYTMKYESAEKRVKVLLHFFEATTAFMTTVHISAFMADDQLWTETQDRFIKKRRNKGEWSLKRASFGTWLMALEYMSGRCEELLEKSEGYELMRKIYGTPNRQVLSMLSSPKLAEILRRANTVRNKYSHDGVRNENEETQTHSELEQYVNEIRGVFRRLWLAFKLIQPRTADLLSSKNINDTKAKLLIGTRTPFEEIRLEFKFQLTKNELYLTDPVSRSVLRLKPFVLVKQSPGPACYFFNERMNNSESRFVSYHFEDESKFVSDVLDNTFSQIYQLG